MPHRSSPRIILVVLFGALPSACAGGGEPTTIPPRPTSPPTIAATALPATMIPTPTLDAADSAATRTAAIREEGLVPFPAPASCAAVALHGPEKRRDFPAYWYDGNGIALGDATAVFYAGGNKVMWQVRDDARPTITGERIDASAPPMMVQNLGLTSGGSISGVEFALSGCWHIRAVAGTETLDAIFFVYPSGCIPSTMRDPNPRATPAPCIAPQERANVSGCPVTQPSDPPLTPPESLGTKTGPYGFWYGNDALWVILRNDGMTWGGKFGWWRTAPGQLTIEGRRLDAPSPPLAASIPSGYGDTGFQVSGLEFPTTGCWEVTGNVAGTELRFVVTVITSRH